MTPNTSALDAAVAAAGEEDAEVAVAACDPHIIVNPEILAMQITADDLSSVSTPVCVSVETYTGILIKACVQKHCAKTSFSSILSDTGC